MLTWENYRNWLGAALRGSLPSGPAPALAAWSSDSRSIAMGEWFVPISGENFDGHRFIEAALQRGAAGFFYAAGRRGEFKDEALSRGIAVEDPLAAFQKIASGWRGSLKNLRLLALTGSTGKTTTKEMLSTILQAAGPTLATQGSFNNEVGVPKTLQSLLPEHRYAALEFGARMPGNIKFLCEMASPDVAALINVGVTHLGIFGSLENLLNTKLEIFRNSPRHAVQVAFHDDPRILGAARATGKKTVTFGSDQQADVGLLDSEWHTGDGKMTVKLRLNGKTTDVLFGIAHDAFPINAAAAAAMALAVGVPEAAIIKGLTGFKGVKGRYQIHKIGSLQLIDDTYNANPDSMRAGLATVQRAFKGRRLVLVLGDMLELGDTSAAEHRLVGRERVAPVSPTLLITVGPDGREIAEGARLGGLDPKRIRSFASVDELFAADLKFEELGDVLYAKASNGIKLSKLVDRLLCKAGSR